MRVVMVRVVMVRVAVRVVVRSGVAAHNVRVRVVHGYWWVMW